MGFQSAVFIQQGGGVPGELFSDYPKRAQSFTLNSASAAYNIVGATAYTISAEGVARAGSGGTLGFAGFLFNPKVYALQGGTTPLAPTMTLPNQTQAELITEGSLWVTLPGAAAIGDLVIYNNTTGAISTVTPATPIPGGSSFANAVVAYFTVTAPGLAVIAISPLLPTPTP